MGRIAGVILFFVLLASAISGVFTNSPNPINLRVATHPTTQSVSLQSDDPTNLTFTNVTSKVRSNGNFEPGAWVAQTAYASNIGEYLTLGGNGFSVYAGGPPPTLPNVASSGYLQGAAWDGNEFLLVGQHYSTCCPGGGDGVLMYKYYPANNSIANVTSLFSPSLSQNATLISTTWNGSVFFILNEIGEAGVPLGHSIPLNLFSYNPIKNALVNLTYLLPAAFRSVRGCCNIQQEFLYTSNGLYFLVQTLGGSRFGVLRGQVFSDLSSQLPSGFHLPNQNGEVTAKFGYHLVWNGSSLFLAGQFTNNSIALFSYNPSSSSMTNYSNLYSTFLVTPVTLTASGSELYLSGYTGTSPKKPFLIVLTTSTRQVADLTFSVPTNFNTIGTSIAIGQTIFVSGGPFGNIQYAILSPPGTLTIPCGGSNPCAAQSNSLISNATFITTNRTIHFVASVSQGTEPFVNVTVAKTAVLNQNDANVRILLNETQLPNANQTKSSNSTHFAHYFTLSMKGIYNVQVCMGYCPSVAVFQNSQLVAITVASALAYLIVSWRRGRTRNIMRPDV